MDTKEPLPADGAPRLVLAECVEAMRSLPAASVDLIIADPPYGYLKGKRVIGSTKKYYFIDPGLRNASNDFMFEDKGPVFENIIYNELLYNGYEVAVGTYDSFSKNAEGITVRKRLEIDFIAKKGPRVLYVQCCQDLSSHDTYEREIKPYIALNDNIAKVLVVNKAMGQELDRNGITIIGATDFILRYIKQTV